MSAQYKKIPNWIIIWLIVSMFIVLWDSGFLFARPASFPGGRLSWLWIPYAKYITIDTSYIDLHNNFLIAQQIMNLVEILISMAALYFNGKKNQVAILFAFSSLLLTGTKTILIFLLEVVSGLQHVGHNSLQDLILFYILPNSLWIIFPFIGVFILGRFLVHDKIV
jgi:hypothetical protein